jgi:preprotein translocase subunit SecB
MDMAETSTTPAAEAKSNAPVFAIQKVYLKETSFEQPNSPAIFLEREQAQVEVSIETSYEKVSDGVYESLLRGTVKSKIGDKVVFNVTVEQAGIFEVRNIPEEQFEPSMQINCPTVLLPALRYNIADLINRAGFPPINIAEMNFGNMYQQKLAQEKEAADKAAPAKA